MVFHISSIRTGFSVFCLKNEDACLGSKWSEWYDVIFGWWFMLTQYSMGIFCPILNALKVVSICRGQWVLYIWCLIIYILILGYKNVPRIINSSSGAADGIIQLMFRIKMMLIIVLLVMSRQERDNTKNNSKAY